MFPNGYIMLDFNGVSEAASSAATVLGLNANLKSALASRKPIAVYNLKKSTSIIYSPYFTYAYIDGTSVVVKTPTKTATVTSSDVVTLA